VKPPVEVSTTEVARLTGATVRQLQHWSTLGLVRATGRPGYGVHRRWTADALRHAAIVADLVNTLGMDPSIASHVADEAMAGIGERWTADVGDITLSGWWPWVPTAPDEDET
jgi:hypothetical protein